MSTQGRVASRRHQRLLPAYVAAVIFGIVAMHAFMQHCPTRLHSMPASTTMVQTTHHAGEHLTNAVSSVISISYGRQVADHPTGGVREMLMLCAAMLLGAGAVLLLLLRRQVNRPLALLPMGTNWWRPLIFVAETGPPPTLAFTVIRC